jgi:membrane protease YdiL (CAAX protease family)
LETSPRFPIRWDPESFPAAPTFFALLGTVALVLCGTIGYTLIEEFVSGNRPATPEKLPLVHTLGAQVTGFALGFVYLLAALPRLAHRSLHELGFRAPTLRDVAIALAGTIGMLYGVWASSDLVVRITHRQDTEVAMQLLASAHSRLEIAIFVFATVIIAPFFEELAFRVFLFSAIERYGGALTGIVVSSIVFGFVHGLSLSVAVPLAVAGVALCTVYALTRCYFASVITHATFNLVVLAAALSQRAG